MTIIENPKVVEGPRQRKNRALPFLIILAILLCAGLVGFPVILRGIGAVLIIADPLKKADAAVALSGDSGDRISEAATLFDQEYVRYLFLTNTDETSVRNMESMANKLGFPYRKILVTEAVVSNTVEEAKAIRQLAEKEGVSSLIIITDPFHTLRTRVIFRDQLRGSEIDLQVRPVRDHWYRSDTWWKTAEGRQYTWEEYFKVFMYNFGVY